MYTEQLIEHPDIQPLMKKFKKKFPIRADILCVDTSDDSYVLVENQLEKTDHCVWINIGLKLIA